MTKFDLEVFNAMEKVNLFEKDTDENLQALDDLRELVGTDAEITVF